MVRRIVRDLWRKYWSLAKRKSDDPLRETRSFLFGCSLPQAVAVFVAVKITLLTDAAMAMKKLVPEDTSFPVVTRFLFWLTDDRSYLGGSLEDHWNSHLALVMGGTWLALVFCLLWWSKDPLVVTRRWIVLTSTGWILVTLWILFVLFANWAPFAVLMTVMYDDPSWLPRWVKEVSWKHAVGLVWCAAVGVAVFRVWRRDRRAVV